MGRKQALTAAAVVASTLDPANKGSTLTLSNGNMTATGDGTNWRSVRGTQFKSSGKRYFEVAFTSGAGMAVGLCNASQSMESYLGDSLNSVGLHSSGAMFLNNVSTAGVTPGWSVNTIGVIVDIGARLVWFSVDGVVGSGNPVAGTGGQDIAAVTGALFPGISSSSANSGTIKFSGFSFTPPTGFAAWDS